MKRLFGILLLLMAVLLFGWISFNLFDLPLHPTPVFLSALALIYGSAILILPIDSLLKKMTTTGRIVAFLTPIAMTTIAILFEQPIYNYLLDNVHRDAWALWLSICAVVAIWIIFYTIVIGILRLFGLQCLKEKKGNI